MDPDAVIRELLLINAAPALTARCRFNSEQSTGHVAPGSYRRCSHCGKDEAGASLRSAGEIIVGGAASRRLLCRW